MKNKFYLTTPIYYVNASPHIGHSYTTIAADTLARYMRKTLGEESVWLLTGTDEHGQKIQRASEAKNLTPRQFVDETVVQFKELWQKLGISYNDFIRTTEERHIRFVQKALDILYKKGDIYQDKYVGLYCTPCETFWLDSQVKNSLCPDCQRPVEKISETNYFFNLEKYQSWLMQHILDNEQFIRPESRRNEVLSFLKMNKLEGLCISRPKERLNWGIPLPFSADHVTYVWFDALTNYISAVGEFNQENKYVSKWWPAELHLIGKDILRQHAIYWPIMLKALDIQLPKTVFAHGWWMMNDDKMSKSKGNVVSPVEMVDKFGIDVYRYFLLRDVPFGLDGNFSEDAIIKRYNSDLANDLGNLVYRTLTMLEKYFQGRIPLALAREEKSKLILSKIENLDQEVAAKLCSQADFNFSAALDKIWELINLANKHVEVTKPWNLAKENNTDGLKEFLWLLVQVIRKVGSALMPFMPRTAALIHEQLGADTIKKGNPLFPRIDLKTSN